MNVSWQHVGAAIWFVAILGLAATWHYHLYQQYREQRRVKQQERRREMEEVFHRSLHEEIPESFYRAMVAEILPEPCQAPRTEEIHEPSQAKASEASASRLPHVQATEGRASRQEPEEPATERATPIADDANRGG
jgi:hypothetical protein